jgi:pimeloyl-ACP methyl ester carboxylesterase
MPPHMRRAARLLVVAVLLAAVLGWFAAPYVKAALLLVRVANAGGRVGAMAEARAYTVTKEARSSVSTRVGAVATQVYRPAGGTGRTIMLIPGIHSMGIEEPRLKGLAEDLAATGHTVVTSALPDLQAYTITQRSADVIEDLVAQLTARTDLAPDGRIGIAGISFAGGLSLAAAGRPRIRDHVAFVLSFGGHGDLPRVMHYLATGEETVVPGVATHPPHDYGVAVILYALAGRGVVPADQVEPLRDGVRTFLLASQLTLVSREQADATFKKAREMAEAMPEPARTYMGYVNDRAVTKLGPVLVPFLNQLGVDDPALSPQRATPPAAPVFLLHGDEDTVIPPAESVLLGDTLRMKGADVHVLLSHLITHAELDRTGDFAEAWRLIAFWADLLSR